MPRASARLNLNGSSGGRADGAGTSSPSNKRRSALDNPQSVAVDDVVLDYGSADADPDTRAPKTSGSDKKVHSEDAPDTNGDPRNTAQSSISSQGVMYTSIPKRSRITYETNLDQNGGDDTDSGAAARPRQPMPPPPPIAALSGQEDDEQEEGQLSPNAAVRALPPGPPPFDQLNEILHRTAPIQPHLESTAALADKYFLPHISSAAVPSSSSPFSTRPLYDSFQSDAASSIDSTWPLYPPSPSYPHLEYYQQYQQQHREQIAPSMAYNPYNPQLSAFPMSPGTGVDHWRSYHDTSSPYSRSEYRPQSHLPPPFYSEESVLFGPTALGGYDGSIQQMAPPTHPPIASSNPSPSFALAQTRHLRHDQQETHPVPWYPSTTANPQLDAKRRKKAEKKRAKKERKAAAAVARFGNVATDMTRSSGTAFDALAAVESDTTDQAAEREAARLLPRRPDAQDIMSQYHQQEVSINIGNAAEFPWTDDQMARAMALVKQVHDHGIPPHRLMAEGVRSDLVENCCSTLGLSLHSHATHAVAKPQERHEEEKAEDPKQDPLHTIEADENVAASQGQVSGLPSNPLEELRKKALASRLATARAQARASATIPSSTGTESTDETAKISLLRTIAAQLRGITSEALASSSASHAPDQNVTSRKRAYRDMDAVSSSIVQDHQDLLDLGYGDSSPHPQPADPREPARQRQKVSYIDESAPKQRLEAPVGEVDLSAPIPTLPSPEPAQAPQTSSTSSRTRPSRPVASDFDSNYHWPQNTDKQQRFLDVPSGLNTLIDVSDDDESQDEDEDSSDDESSDDGDDMAEPGVNNRLKTAASQRGMNSKELLQIRRRTAQELHGTWRMLRGLPPYQAPTTRSHPVSGAESLANGGESSSQTPTSQQKELERKELEIQLLMNKIRELEKSRKNGATAMPDGGSASISTNLDHANRGSPSPVPNSSSAAHPEAKKTNVPPTSGYGSGSGGIRLDPTLARQREMLLASLQSSKIRREQQQQQQQLDTQSQPSCHQEDDSVEKEETLSSELPAGSGVDFRVGTAETQRTADSPLNQEDYVGSADEGSITENYREPATSKGRQESDVSEAVKPALSTESSSSATMPGASRYVPIVPRLLQSFSERFRAYIPLRLRASSSSGKPSSSLTAKGTEAPTTYTTDEERRRSGLDAMEDADESHLARVEDRKWCPREADSGTCNLKSCQLAHVRDFEQEEEGDDDDDNDEEADE